MSPTWTSKRKEISGTLLDDSSAKDLAALSKACYISAGFKVGPPQYFLQREPGTHGAHLPGYFTWDPAHVVPISDFYSVAFVRFDVSRTQACWSVGTNPFLTLPASPNDYHKITEVCVTASLGPDPSTKDDTKAHDLQRLVQWNSLDLTFIDAAGHSDTWSSSCLPMIWSPQAPRCAATSGKKPDESPKPRASYAKFRILDADTIVAVQIRGQVTLSANLVYEQRGDLGPDDLSGNIFIFTDKHPAPQTETRSCSQQEPC